MTGFNQAIAAEAGARRRAGRQYALFGRLEQTGVVVSGVRFTFRYITGGLFSLDGIHPSGLGSALLANTFIESINQKFGARIPPYSLGAVSIPYSGEPQTVATR